MHENNTACKGLVLKIKKIQAVSKEIKNGSWG